MIHIVEATQETQTLFPFLPVGWAGWELRVKSDGDGPGESWTGPGAFPLPTSQRHVSPISRM